MDIILKRTNNLATFFWKYSIHINGETFFIKNSSANLVSIKDGAEIFITINYNNYYKQSFTIHNALTCKEIIITSRVSNIQWLICCVVSILSLILFILTKNSAFIWGWILLISIWGIFIFDVSRKNFFRVKINRET